MSLTKKNKIGIFFLLILFSFFMFGCEKTTPVEDICFNLGESEQIVLIVGQTLEMGNYVEVRPHYASNKGYTIVSCDESVVKVEQNSLVAVGVGDSYIKVISNDNSLKEDIMSVVVKGTKTVLSTPKNLIYDSSTQTFNFDTVQNATSYTLRLNGEEINLGNSNSYKLTQSDVFDNRLVVQVRANAPTYTYALENSAYTDEMKIYQAGAVKNAVIKNGLLTFEKASNKSVANIFIGQDVAFENTAETSFSFNNLDKSYAGKTIKIRIDSLVSDEIKEEFGDDVEYFNSTKELEVNVLDIPTIKLASTRLSWQNIAYVSGYSIIVDGNEVAQTEKNYFDLKTLNNFDALISSSQVHNIIVMPLTADENNNIVKTNEESIIKVKRLTAPTLSFTASSISWIQDLNASAYAVVVSNGENIFETSIVSTILTTNGYNAGNYTISIQSIAKETADADNVYYISSKSSLEKFEKKADVIADIVNYELIITNAGTDTIKVDFDDDALDEIKVGNNEDIVISLKEHKFTTGTHEVYVTRLAGNSLEGNFVDGTPWRKEFTQLEKIESATIENGTIKVQKSDTNKNAIVTLSTIGGSLSKPFVVESDEYTYNTTNNVPETNFLASGNYTTLIYAYGDGSSTFSYRDDAGLVAVCLVKEFNVLPAPTVAVLNPQNDEITITAVDNAESYDVYNLTEQSKANVSELVYPFTLGETGNIQFAVQAIGDGEVFLDSVVSSPISIERLKKPTLTYDHTTEIISKSDDNIEGAVSGYEFKHNGEVVDYDFASKYPLTEDAIFTIQAISVGFKNGVYYLNSSVADLSLNKISNQATISLTEDNKLEIAPTSHIERYALEVVFGFEDGNHTYISQSDSLTDGNNIINFTYSDGKYVLDLVNAEHNAVVEGFNKEFSVKVKFIKLEDNNKNLIDSEYTAEQNFNLIKISNATTISINQNNQIEIKPTEHDEEYSLIVVINDGEEKTFISNGSNKLIGTVGELNYSYDADNKVYKVDLLKSDLTTAISGLNSDFTVKVKYCYNHNGVATDLDSEFSQVQNVDVLPVAEITREAQNLKIKNVQQTYTIANYALLINDNYILELAEQDVTYIEGYFTFELDLVYEKVPSVNLSDINSISVLVKNIETSEQNPQLSILGEKLYVSKTETIELVSYKFNNNEDGNNNNSAVIEFENYSTSYTKQYVIEIYNTGGTNKQIKRFEDRDAVNGKISFNMDDVVGVEGVIFIKAYVATVGNYVETNTIEMFNSVYSNEIERERISAVQDLIVSDSVLKFSNSNNVVGYEVYEKTLSSYVKLNTDLILKNEYTISNISGVKQIVVKAISQTDGFSNSSYSEPISIHKLSTPTINVVDGKFHVGLSPELILLLTDEKVNIIPEINNNQTDKISLNLKDLNGVDMQLIGTTLIAEPYKFLTYNAQSLLPEELSLQIRVEYDEKTTDVYYINSNVVKINAYGLFKPTNVSKTTNSNDYVELLTWQPSTKNVLDGTNVSVGYLLKIKHSVGEESTTYFSNDAKLKYYDTANSKFVSYPTYINGSSAIFPAGYDADGDGKLDVKFDEGEFKISIQAVPTEIGSSYALCRSQYTDVYEFEILEQVELSMKEGAIIWEHQVKANKYQVSIYENETDVVFVDTTLTATYDFTNATLKALSGVYKVVVKPISLVEDTVNGKESEPIYIYRLPEAYGVHIDDGELVLTSTAFYDLAEFEFVDNTTGAIYVEKIDNSTFATQKLSELKIESWKDFVDDATINISTKNTLVLGKQAASIIDGRDYTINVTLKGNSNSDLGFVSSSKVVKIADLTTSKLKPNATEVSLGVVQFAPDKDYATISKDVFEIEDGVELNYMFNNTQATGFWKNTVVYKIELTYSEGVLEIFAVDYYSLLTAISNGTISASEYEILSNTNNLYANVKYKYTDSSEKYIYFNVFKENIINLKDYDYLEYYQTTSSMTDGVNTFASEATMKNLNLEVGGSFTLNFFMMGGDDKNSAGCLSSGANGLKTFVRYGINELSSSEGKVKFNNLLPIVASKEIDNPIYKIVVTELNSSENKVFYLYHSTEEDAKAIASRLDANYLSATYVKVELDEENKENVLFDLSNYIADGAYKASIRTLAGLGVEEGSADYLLNAKEPLVEYSFYKLTDTKFEASQGVLKFAQSYIVRGTTVYNDNYEITLIEKETETEYVYQINRTSDGVVVNDTTHIVTYTLPSQIVVGDKTIEITSNKQYEIKIKPIAKENYVLNGTYLQQSNQDVVLTFKKSEGLSELEGEDLRIEDGILKWNVIDVENHINTVIQISFLDENEQIKYIKLTVADMNKVVENGEYKYHFYEFTDEKYNLETTGSVYIVDGEEYTIKAYVTGRNTAGEIILNSNYSSEIKTTRLISVGSEIKTVDGVLTWNAIENAVSYNVIITGAKKHEITVETNSLNVLESGLNLPVGTYSVQIRANGTTQINSMQSSIIEGFVQLGAVDKGTIKIESGKIVWNAVQGAQGYKVVFSYIDVDGVQQEATEIVETNEYVAPVGVVGEFSATITAVGIGESKVFNGATMTPPYTSSSSAPTQAQNLKFDDVNNRFVAEINLSDFYPESDDVMFVYSLDEFISDTETKTQRIVRTTITYEDMDKYEVIDENTIRYYCPITIIGIYSDIYVQIIRPETLPSNAIQTDDINFKLFSFGAGTFDNPETQEDEYNPYRISSAQELLNIKYFPSANYILTQSINMKDVNIAERLQANSGALISSEFKGMLDGNNFSIFGFNKNETERTDTILVTDYGTFALFGTLDEAIIKNITFGEENYTLILLNTFANSMPNMINLSLIATGATNSTIEKIKVLDFKVLVSSNRVKDEGSINIAGMIVNSTNTTIKDITETLLVKIDMYVENNVDVRIGGIITNATNSTITAENVGGTSIDFSVETKSDNLLSYVGGAVAYYMGNTAKSTGITNTNVEFTISSVQSTYFGGLIGFARYANIQNCETTGTYYQQGINYTAYIGGLVGYASSVTIQNSGSLADLTLTVESYDGLVYVGAIAGTLTMQNNIPCVVQNCYSHVYNKDQLKSQIIDKIVNVGIYGNDINQSISVTGCYKKEK